MTGARHDRTVAFYASPMSLTNPATSRGSRTAAYLMAWLVATVPAWFAMGVFLGPLGALGGLVVLWTSGVVWLLQQRRDPRWDSRLPHEPE